VSRDEARFKTTSAESSRNRLVEYAAGQYIFRAGDLGAEMFVVRKGRVEILGGSVSPEQDDERLVAVLEKGDFFGEMAILEGLPRSASVRALTEVELVRIDGTTFTQLLRAQPEIAVRIMRKLSRRLRESEARHRGAVSSSAAPGETGSVALSGTVQRSARLVHSESGNEFLLPTLEPILIGRRDPITGIQPHIDLSPVDPERSCSRQHARIRREGTTFTITEDIGTTNGTYLNGERLETGVPAAVEDGDEVRLGSVSLLFEVMEDS
jgi:CRP-like cAMP-binding protein